jgi:hypothetical protein
MIAATRAIDILLVEDDPGDELITREAFEHNKLQNRLHVAHDGEEGLDCPGLPWSTLPARFLRGSAAAGPDPA